jgi:membrane protein YdbS with pleckstrin-like domain
MTATSDHTAVEHAHDEHAAHAKNEHDGEHIPSDLYFIKVAVVLAIVTGLETSTYWWPHSMHAVATPALLIMMTIKFFMIVLIFMHLKFDSKVFGFMFYTGLGLALFVYLVFLFTFQFFRS